MKKILSLVVCLLLTSCGYHLVGQGESVIIPKDVRSASLITNAGEKGKALLAELQHLWSQHETLPVLQDKAADDKHITLRIEGTQQTFVPVAFDASGLAIQYRLQISAILNMYQHETLLWGSGMMSVNASVFGDAAAAANNPSAVEAERETLTEQLNQQWAQDVIARLQSGF